MSLGLLELYLRHFPHTLPHALANHLTTPYHTGPSGIYRWAPELRTTLMHPNHERMIYFNGYRWRHKTDSRGFRNPVETLTASVVLLGDSIVYGHGVEEVSTIRITSRRSWASRWPTWAFRAARSTTSTRC